MGIKEAFFEACSDARPASAEMYVSLYRDEPYYGGPEEGGWWGRDTVLVAFKAFLTEAQAQAALTAVKELAAQLSAQAREGFYRQCAAECEWLEDRGLDPSFLPEPDGEVSYWVTVEGTPGEHRQTGSRYYE